MSGIEILACRETIFYREEGGSLHQWLEVDLESPVSSANVSFEVRSGGRSARRLLVIPRTRPGERLTVRIPAPVRWPRTPDANARLRVRRRGQRLDMRITIGTHRPWTFYLLSDLCADDTWAYGDLAAHDRDDYLATLAELTCGPSNCYNLPTTHQVERFLRQATAAQRRAFKKAVRDGRIYVSPIPNQLNSACFLLGAYPLLLEPFRRGCAALGLEPARWTSDAYHMEAPTWPNGLVNLLTCAGFRSFGKSLLAFQAPWLDVLATLPRLTRLQCAPGRFVYLLLRCGDYREGARVLAGVPAASRLLHEEAIPRHEAWGDRYPITAIPLVGTYCDLMPDSHRLAEVKARAVREYNRQGWDYPKLLDATWPQFFEHVHRELGEPAGPAAARRLRTVRGDTGCSWEIWPLAAQQENARFRAAQRQAASVTALHAMLAKAPAGAAGKLQQITSEVVALADHAWNGSSPASCRLNLAIRRRRLERIETQLAAVRRDLAADHAPRPGEGFVAVNTLGWRRSCRVRLPEECLQAPCHVFDPATGTAAPVRALDGQAVAEVPAVPAFGAKRVELRAGAAEPRRVRGPDPSVRDLPVERMGPVLAVAGRPVRPTGRWRGAGRGRWTVGPFRLTATVVPARPGGGSELLLHVAGPPPAEPYDLAWRFGLPWKRCTWRGESGGGFVTPGPTDRGGDSLLGITGSVLAVGEGLCAVSPSGRSRVEFALGESGACGLGGPASIAAFRWRSTSTPGRLLWHLLSTGQNPTEALPDQGGVRRWAFHAAVRVCKGPPDDAALYRYAAGFNHPAELLAAEAFRRVDPPWLVLRGSRKVLALRVSRQDGQVAVDLLNASDRRARVTLAGRATARRRVWIADMLGRLLERRPDRSIPLAPRAFCRAILR
jgi:hypothetical protein